MTAPRGFGVAAAAGTSVAASLAPHVEALGYASLWTNDTPRADGIAFAAAAARTTSSIRLGIGALPCDRRSAGDVAAALTGSGIPPERAVVVVGAGKASDPLVAVASTVSGLRERFGSNLKVGVAALGPAMCRLAGRIADLVLLNWADPERIAWSKRRIARGAAERADGLSGAPEIASYVRAALGPAASDLLEQEASGYRGISHYARHFQAMGKAPAIAAPDPARLDALLSAYDTLLDETVVRAVTAEPSVEELLGIARAGMGAASR